jgi:3-methylfumaryl-CoA hydratase
MSSQPIRSWIGNEERQSDVVDAVRAQRMHAFLDRPIDELKRGLTLPRGYHWLYCVSIIPRSDWGVDGHARPGSFLPPLTGTRRMWAGGSLHFVQSLFVGDSIERHSVIRSIDEKEGRNGKFHLVRVNHQISRPNGIAIVEQQNLVYLPASSKPADSAGTKLTETPDWQETFTTDEITLFYFSALTYNGHRIHYDQPYATDGEGYPALLVHAPLTALLLLDAARRNGHGIRDFTYRATAPLFCRDTITLCGKTEKDGSAKVWALRPDGGIAMEATVAT